MRLFLALLVVGRLYAADTSYLGTWKIASAAAAPWVVKPYEGDTKEMKTLIGKTITFTPKTIQGPRVFVCNGAKYAVKDYPADMVFQGGFDEMRRKNPSADPAKLAARVGFRGTPIRTLETGCEIDYHFIDSTTATFALDNYVYTIKKQ
jgi:hypothetical protein